MPLNLDDYQSIQIKENNEPLVDLNLSNFLLEPAYFNQGFSTEERIFLRKEVVKKLTLIQKGLQLYKFKIWDGFRPRSVQNKIYKEFWRDLKDKNPEWNDGRLAIETRVFASNGEDFSKIPPHVTGGAVDLTLVDFNGKELEMGSVFDHLGPESHSLYFEKSSLNIVARENRRLLREAMLAGGFSCYADEWWHFDYGNQWWAANLDKPSALYGEVSEVLI